VHTDGVGGQKRTQEVTPPGRGMFKSPGIIGNIGKILKSELRI